LAPGLPRAESFRACFPALDRSRAERISYEGR
jgi:hypothetical protein